MVTSELKAKGAFKPFSVRRQVNRRIASFAVLVGSLGLILAVVVYVAIMYPTEERWRRANVRTLSEIKCDDSGCDSAVFSRDWIPDLSDYVVDTATRYRFNVQPSSEETLDNFPLGFSDVAFIQKFRQPESYLTPDSETWRLYSKRASWPDRDVEIVLGYAQKAPWKMVETPPSLVHVIDEKLKAEAERIAANGWRESEVANSAVVNGWKLSADGFEIMDANNGRTIYRGDWVPMFLPGSVRPPKPGLDLYRQGSDLYLTRTDVSGRLVATSIIPLDNIWRLCILGFSAFLIVTVAARWLGARFLRNYFTLAGAQVPTIAEALARGEGQEVEFKRGLPTDEARESVDTELLKSIAAFANTNNGAIFVGVDDHGAIKGLQLDHKKRDVFEQRISALVRNRIRPTPPIQITFAEIRGLLVSKIAVARGGALAYLLNGVIYVRYGSSDVPAQPEDLARLVA